MASHQAAAGRRGMEEAAVGEPRARAATSESINTARDPRGVGVEEACTRLAAVRMQAAPTSPYTQAVAGARQRERLHSMNGGGGGRGG